MDLQVVNDCQVLAEYENGTPLVVVNSNDNSDAPARHVTLNFFPVSTTVADETVFYTNTTDGALLLRNAVTWCVEGNTMMQKRRSMDDGATDNHDEKEDEL